MGMKRKIHTIVLTGATLFLCACQYTAQSPGSAGSTEIFQESFTVGGIEVSASEGLNRTLTGTELTDAVEKLLADKYGEDFCCEQYLYYEETALNMELTAYPAAHPEFLFDVAVQGNDELEIWNDTYYNELYRKEIDAYVYEALKPYGILQGEMFVDHLYMVTTTDISTETFYRQPMSIVISVPEDRVEEIGDNIQDIIADIYARVQSEHDFWVYLCQDGIHSWEDFDYDRIWESYRVEYVAEPTNGSCEGYQDPDMTDEGQAHLEVFLGSVPGLYCEIPIQNEETMTSTQGDYPALIMAGGVLYQDSGEISTQLRCGMMDGEITASVDTVPTEDDQSNFGTGYGYQWGMGDTVEVLLDDGWHIFVPYTCTGVSENGSK